MRTFLVLLTCVIIVVVVVVSVVIFAPEPSRKDLVISRIDINRQSHPVLQSDPGADHILEFFPEPTEFPSPSHSFQSDDNEPTTQPAPSQEEEDQVISAELDRNSLLSLIMDWNYVDFMMVGSTKSGTIHQQRLNNYLSVFEGMTLENGILVSRLSSEVALLKYGEAEFPLQRAVEPEFFKNVKETLRPLTPKEQEEAWEYYMKRYGRKFQEYSKGYKPPHGMKNPRPVSQEEQAKGLKEYWARYGQQFRNENQKNKPEFPYGEKQKELFEKYWALHHPGKPMPDFEQLYGNRKAQPPWSRINASLDSSKQ